MGDEWHQIRDSVLVPKRSAKAQFRASILSDWGRLCAYCGSPDDLTIDHVRPRFRGGGNDRANLVCCCSPCNRRKGSADWVEWYRDQDFHCPHKEAAISRWTGEAARGGDEMELAAA
jgi:5-methylcytosine-specific restriction endonuclease McrA